MKKLQTTDNFSAIKFSPILVKTTSLLYMKHEITSIEKFHNKVQMALKRNFNIIINKTASIMCNITVAIKIMSQ